MRCRDIGARRSRGQRGPRSQEFDSVCLSPVRPSAAAVDAGTARGSSEVPALAPLHRGELLPGDHEYPPLLRAGRGRSGRAVFARAIPGLLNEGLSLLPDLLGERLSLLHDLLGEEPSLLLGPLDKRLSPLKDLVNERLSV